MMERINLKVTEIVRMLLIMAGLGTNPGPVSRIYLLHKPLTPAPSPPIKIICCDGGFFGDFSIISVSSKKFRDLFEPPTCACKEQCQSCAPVVHLPQFSKTTMTHLVQLLSTGETNVTEEEEKSVRQLQAALGSGGVSRQEKVQLEPSQCKHCYR